MTKEQFLFQLEQQLLDIPQDEREEALEYYRDYFNDAGEENEEGVIAELGSPKKVAASIKEGLKSGREDTAGDGQLPQARGGTKSYSEANRGKARSDGRSKWILRQALLYPVMMLILMLIVVCFTFPIWIGLAAALIGILIGVAAVLIGLTIAAVTIMAAGFFAGVVCVVVGIARLVTGRFLSGIMTFALGMLAFAAGCLFLALLVLIFGQFFPWLLRSISNVLHRGRKSRRRVSVNE